MAGFHSSTTGRRFWVSQLYCWQKVLGLPALLLAEVSGFPSSTASTNRSSHVNCCATLRTYLSQLLIQREQRSKATEEQACPAFGNHVEYAHAPHMTRARQRSLPALACARSIARWACSHAISLERHLLPSARMRSEGTVVGSVCLLLSISLHGCLSVSQRRRPT